MATDRYVLEDLESSPDAEDLEIDYLELSDALIAEADAVFLSYDETEQRGGNR